MQQIANILEQPISPQTSPRKTRKRPYSPVMFIPVGAENIYIFEFSAAIFAGDLYLFMYGLKFKMRKIPKIPTKINNQIDILTVLTSIDQNTQPKADQTDN
jgi:hypothetical protein